MSDLKRTTKEQLLRRLDELSLLPALDDEVRFLLHELEVHQVELELQNRELREAQQALEVSRDRYVDLYLHAPLGYLTLDERARVQDINYMAAALLGCGRGDVQERLLYPWLQTADWPRLLSHLRQALTDRGGATLEISLRRMDGKRREVHLESFGIRGSGDGPRLCRTAMLDITAQKAAEQARQHSEQLTYALMDSLEDAILVLDAQGIALRVNTVWRLLAQACGCNNGRIDGFPGIQDLDVWHRKTAVAQAALLWEGIRGVLEGRLPQFYQEYLCHAAGIQRWLALHAVPIRNELRGMVLTYRDITQRVCKDAAQCEQQERYELALRGANDGLWDWNLDTQTLYLSPRWKSMLGYAEDAINNDLETCKKLLHPDDLKPVFEQVQAFLDERIPNYEMEFRMRHRDGHWVYILSRAFLVKRDGRPVRLVGTHVDITERKQAEAQLRLAARVFERPAEGVVVTDAQQRILTVNQAFTQVTGYSRAEAIGQTPMLLKSGHHSAGFYQELWQALQTKGWWQGEIWNRRKNGDIYLEWLSINSVKDETGQVLNYVGIFTDITRIKASQQRMEFFATHDALTALPNRFLFQDRLQLALARAERGGVLLALLFVDLDNFKMVNDTLGHQAGDALLQQAGGRLLDCVRTEDSVARLGGDEFVILTEIERRETVIVLAERILQSLAASYTLAEHEYVVSASMGISLFPDHASDAEGLLRQADTAMYQAKVQGKNRYQFFTDDMATRARQRLSIESGLRRALHRQELFLTYQPQVDIISQLPVGAEALIRWQNGEELIMPGDFIPVAEESDLIIELGEWVIATACRQLQTWEQIGLTNLRLSLNLSARHLRQADAVARLVEIVTQAGVAPAQLCLEITEGALMDAERAAPLLQRLRTLGFEVSIDDFGTGFSSLIYLKRYPIQELKIDRSFIKGIVHDPDDRAIVSAIIAMCRSLELRVVAEGVETLAQHRELQALGCAVGQGFLYAQSLLPATLETWWRASHAASMKTVTST